MVKYPVNRLNISTLMQQGISQEVFPGAVLLFSVDQKIVYHRAFGVTDGLSKQVMHKNDIFDLASLTKPLATTLAIVKLMEDHRLSLNRTLKSILPGRGDLPMDRHVPDITIDMLLRHTSGLPAHREFFKQIPPESENKQAQLRHLVLKEPLVYLPGTDQLYSDLGYILLSWVIEIISGQPLDQFISREVYSPLGIEDLFFIPLLAGKNGLIHQNHRLVSTENCNWRGKVLKGEVHDDNAWISGGVEGHAGLFGDAESIHTVCCEFLTAMQHQQTKVIPADLFSGFLKPCAPFPMLAGFDTPSKTGSSSGHFFSENSIGHLGFTGTSFWIDPEKSLIVILLTNRVHPSRNNNRIREFRPRIHDLIIQEGI